MGTWSRESVGGNATSRGGELEAGWGCCACCWKCCSVVLLGSRDWTNMTGNICEIWLPGYHACQPWGVMYKYAVGGWEAGGCGDGTDGMTELSGLLVVVEVVVVESMPAVCLIGDSGPVSGDGAVTATASAVEVSTDDVTSGSSGSAGSVNSVSLLLIHSITVGVDGLGWVTVVPGLPIVEY